MLHVVIPVRISSVRALALLLAVCTSAKAATPTPTATPTAVVIGIGDFCEPDRICLPPLRCLIDPPQQARVCACVGDCDGNGAVTVDELLTLVNIALGSTAASVCLQGDSNGDGQIDISEILQAVNGALYGCAVASPTPTPASQCRPCGGSCVISACTPGPDGICPDYVLLGECQADSAGTCRCVPVVPATPTPTPTTDQTLEKCNPSANDCPVGKTCNCCCGAWVCMPPYVPCCALPCSVPTLLPTSTPTPTVCTQCVPHGHTCCECPNQPSACVDFAWVEAERTCPAGCATFMDSECEAACQGGPLTGPAICASLTPCQSDADCDDGNGCTADLCTIDGCTHQCVCL